MDFALNYRKKQLEEIKRLPSLLTELIDVEECDLAISAYVTAEPVPFAEHLQGDYRSFQVGESWGQLFDCGWFKLRGQLNPSAHPRFLKLDLSGEALLYDAAGHAIKGFTNGSSVFSRAHGEPGKKYFDISEFIQPNGHIELTVEAGCNDLFGELQDNGAIIEAKIITRNDALLELYYDVESLIFLLDSFAPDAAEYQALFDDLYQIYLLTVYGDAALLSTARSICARHLAGQSDESFTFSAIGHAHIDLAWLWPIRETRRKAGRTLANVFYLLEKYPEFTFGISQPQLVEWLRTDYPDLFAKLKHYVDQGRIEVQGGAWVEMDTNVPDEESLVRQMLYGIRYWRETFGQSVTSLWLPDVFGYNANLPQIIKKSGLDHFMTTKMSWCLRNLFPHHTFYFEGIDGSRVLTHMPPEGTYNSAVHVQKLKQARQHYRQQAVSDQALVLFGIGDGGGGPGDEHLERIRRNNRISSSPKVEIRTSEAFFARLDQADNDYPIWSGELYLENHQGTYTSQANVKRFNKRLESKLKLVEQLLVATGRTGFQAQLDAIWKEVLLYQFHDILPGSSIKRVYDECLARYQHLDASLDQVLGALFSGGYTTHPDANSVFYNPLNQVAQVTYHHLGAYHIAEIDKLSADVISRKVLNHMPAEFQHRIETASLVFTFDPQSGFIDQISDQKTQRHYLSGRSNELLVYRDLGNAWDIADHYRQQTPQPLTLCQQTYRCFGELHEIINRYRFQHSTVTETVLIREGANLVEFRHDVDWQDLGYMLRSRFEPAVQADQATFDVQFGHYRRSRRHATPRESAQFEVCGQNWVDVRDDHVGVALLSQGKYGHYIKDSTLDINLLRSTNYPCEQGDIGRTSYAYALLLHDGHLPYRAVDDCALQLNAIYPAFSRPVDLKLPIKLSQGAVEIAAIKHAYGNSDKGTDNAIILRLYEKQGDRQQVTVDLGQRFIRIDEVNLVEDPVGQHPVSDRLALTFSPFEVRTLKLYPASKT